MARKKKATPERLFSEWWEKKGLAKVSRIEKRWIKNNPPNEEGEEFGGDHWHVNRMMHEGGAAEMTYEPASRVFMMGFRGEMWEPGMEDSLFCELDSVVEDAYLAGKEMVS